MINILKYLHINLSDNQNNILFLDIDDTLLKAQNIFIYSNINGLNQTYTPEEYAKINVKIEDKKYYDYSDFRDPSIIKNSILTSIPIKENLRDIDNFVEEGFHLGILTARGQEDVIARIMPKWLNRNLKNKFPRICRDHIHATSDERKNYLGSSDATRKLLVLKEYVESGKFTNIIFLDDNLFTIKLIRKYNKTIPKNKRIQLLVAKKLKN